MMRILLGAAAALLLGAATALGADEAAFSGQGPLPVRNFQPIQLIFLNLPFERQFTIITTALRNKPAETVYHISRREIVLSRFSLGSSVTDT